MPASVNSERSAIASAALLLRHTAGLEQEAREIEEAITRVLGAGYRTQDLRDGASRSRHLRG